jgi:hypothetical protein
VIYFATLPTNFRTLQSTGNSLRKLQSKISSDVVGVTFGQDGGKDFDDEFHYWINKQTHKVDYLAYSYRTNDGGVRFRTAFNTRVIDGLFRIISIMKHL